MNLLRSKICKRLPGSDSIIYLVGVPDSPFDHKTLVEDDIKEGDPRLVFAQIDPMKQIFKTRKVQEIYYANQYKKELLNEMNDAKGLENNLSEMKKQYRKFFPLNIEESGLNMYHLQFLYNAEFKVDTAPLNSSVFSEEFDTIGRKKRTIGLDSEEQKLFDGKYNILKPYLTYAADTLISTVNPPKLNGSNEIHRHSINSVVDFCYGDMPEVNFRLFLDRVGAPIDQIFNSVLGGIKHMRKSVIDKIKDDKVAQSLLIKKIANERFPRFFIDPRAEYIASALYKGGTKGMVPILGYVEEQYFEAIHSLLEDPIDIITHELFFPHTIWEDEKVDIESSPIDFDLKIKNQAIAEVMFGTKIWAEPYLSSNMKFPYISLDESAFTDKRLDEYKKQFYKHYIDHLKIKDDVFK